MEPFGSHDLVGQLGGGRAPAQDDHVHVEGPGPAGHGLVDRAEADEADGPVSEPFAVHRPPLPALLVGVQPADLLELAQDPGEHELRDRGGVGSRGVGEPDAGLSQPRGGEMGDPDPQRLDPSQPGGHCGHIEREVQRQAAVDAGKRIPLLVRQRGCQVPHLIVGRDPPARAQLARLLVGLDNDLYPGVDRGQFGQVLFEAVVELRGVEHSHDQPVAHRVDLGLTGPGRRSCRPGQEEQGRLHGAVGPVEDAGVLDAAQRVLDGHDPGAGQAQSGRHLRGEGLEGGGGHQDGGNASGFEADGVVDTPRRAAASIG